MKDDSFLIDAAAAKHLSAVQLASVAMRHATETFAKISERMAKENVPAATRAEIERSFADALRTFASQLRTLTHDD
jgi:hypothetical protein